MSTYRPPSESDYNQPQVPLHEQNYRRAVVDGQTAALGELAKQNALLEQQARDHSAAQAQLERFRAAQTEMLNELHAVELQRLSAEEARLRKEAEARKQAECEKKYLLVWRDAIVEVGNRVGAFDGSAESPALGNREAADIAFTLDWLGGKKPENATLEDIKEFASITKAWKSCLTKARGEMHVVENPVLDIEREFKTACDATAVFRKRIEPLMDEAWNWLRRLAIASPNHPVTPTDTSRALSWHRAACAEYQSAQRELRELLAAMLADGIRIDQNLFRFGTAINSAALRWVDLQAAHLNEDSLNEVIELLEAQELRRSTLVFVETFAGLPGTDEASVVVHALKEIHRRADLIASAFSRLQEIDTLGVAECERQNHRRAGRIATILGNLDSSAGREFRTAKRADALSAALDAHFDSVFAIDTEVGTQAAACEDFQKMSGSAFDRYLTAMESIPDRKAKLKSIADGLANHFTHESLDDATEAVRITQDELALLSADAAIRLKSARDLLAEKSNEWTVARNAGALMLGLGFLSIGTGGFWSGGGFWNAWTLGFLTLALSLLGFSLPALSLVGTDSIKFSRIVKLISALE